MGAQLRSHALLGGVQPSLEVGNTPCMAVLCCCGGCPPYASGPQLSGDWEDVIPKHELVLPLHSDVYYVY